MIDGYRNEMEEDKVWQQWQFKLEMTENRSAAFLVDSYTLCRATKLEPEMDEMGYHTTQISIVHDGRA